MLHVWLKTFQPNVNFSVWYTKYRLLNTLLYNNHLFLLDKTRETFIVFCCVSSHGYFSAGYFTWLVVVFDVPGWKSKQVQMHWFLMTFNFPYKSHEVWGSNPMRLKIWDRHLRCRNVNTPLETYKQVEIEERKKDGSHPSAVLWENNPEILEK